jgi:glycosyltransferase involved in cell wall biosynthesis
MLTDADFHNLALTAALRGQCRLPSGFHGWPVPQKAAFGREVHATLQKPSRSRGPASSRPKAAAPLRVCILTPTLLLGGAEKWIALLCRFLDRELVRITDIVVRDRGRTSPTMIAQIPRDVVIHEGTDYFRSVAGGCDLLLSWGCPELPELTDGLGLPMVDVQHGTSAYQHQHDLARAAVKAGARLTAVSAACLSNFDERIRGKVTVLPNGADPADAAPRHGRDAMRRRLGLSAADRLAVYIGRVSGEKNLECLIEAAGLLPRQWRTAIVGPKWYDPWNLAGEPRASHYAAVPHVGDWLAASDCFVLPSHFEAHPIALNEAWLAGVPTVTTDLPCVQWFVNQHGDMGWRVPINPTGKQLAAAIEEAGESGRDAPRVRNARAVAWERYTATAMAGRWEKFLNGENF